MLYQTTKIMKKKKNKKNKLKSEQQTNIYSINVLMSLFEEFECLRLDEFINNNNIIKQKKSKKKIQKQNV